MYTMLDDQSATFRQAAVIQALHDPNAFNVFQLILYTMSDTREAAQEELIAAGMASGMDDTLGVSGCMNVDDADGITSHHSLPLSLFPLPLPRLRLLRSLSKRRTHLLPHLTSLRRNWRTGDPSTKLVSRHGRRSQPSLVRRLRRRVLGSKSSARRSARLHRVVTPRLRSSARRQRLARRSCKRNSRAARLTPRRLLMTVLQRIRLSVAKRSRRLGRWSRRLASLPAKR